MNNKEQILEAYLNGHAEIRDIIGNEVKTEYQKGYEAAIAEAAEWMKRHSATIYSHGERLYGIDIKHFSEGLKFKNHKRK